MQIKPKLPERASLRLAARGSRACLGIALLSRALPSLATVPSGLWRQSPGPVQTPVPTPGSTGRPGWPSCRPHFLQALLQNTMASSHLPRFDGRR